MKHIFFCAVVGTAFLGATSSIQAQPASEKPSYVLKFHLSDTAKPEVTVVENEKFSLSVKDGNMTWNLQGTSVKRDNGLGLDVNITSKQVTANGSGSGQVRSNTILNMDGRPVKLGKIFASFTGGTPQSYDITATVVEKNQ